MTLPAVSTLRKEVADIIQAGTSFSVYAFPPQTITANSVVVVPDDPYLEPNNDSWATVGPTANLKLMINVPAFDNKGNLIGIEGAIVEVFNALFDGTESDQIAYSVGTVSQPQILNVASGDLLSCEMAVSLVTSWS